MQITFLTSLLIPLLLCPSPIAPGWLGLAPQEEVNKTTQAQIDEESVDYFKQWLEGGVKYIITEEEEDIFRNLTTDEEKEVFIEQFWFRRDPDPRSSINEYKEEHYRRIAYANQWFKSGKAGWMTDRGRIYIIHGPPDEKESHPQGGLIFDPFGRGADRPRPFPLKSGAIGHKSDRGSEIHRNHHGSTGGSTDIYPQPWASHSIAQLSGLRLSIRWGDRYLRDRERGC